MLERVPLTDDVRRALRVLDKCKKTKQPRIELWVLADIASCSDEDVMHTAHWSGTACESGKIAVTMESVRVALRRKEREQRRELLSIL